MTITTKRMLATLCAVGMLGVGMVRADVPWTTNSIPYTNTFELATAGSMATNLAGWMAAGNDQSVITNVAYSFAAACGVSLPTNAGTHVLQLNTQGDILTNNFGDISAQTSPVYIDTMVQFVPSDTIPSTINGTGDVGVKLAVYLDSTTTNLMIYHGWLANGAKNLTSNGVSQITSMGIIDTGAWYRLTITFDGTVATTIPSSKFPCALVKINGIVVTNADAYTDTDKLNWASTAPAGTSANGTWFRTATDTTARDFQSLGFQGTGYIDGLAVYGTDPLPLTAYYTITQVIGPNITASDTRTTIASVAAGTPTSLTYAAQGYYSINTLTTNNVAAAAGLPDTVNYGPASTKTLTFNVNGNVTISNSTYLIQRNITVSKLGTGTGTASPSSVSPVNNGAAVSVLFTADPWNRITAAAPNGSTGGTTVTPSLTHVTADTVFSATFSALGSQLVTGVPNSWAMGYYPTSESGASGNANLLRDYMLNENPTVTFTPALTVNSIAVTGTTVNVVVKLSSVPTLPVTINGNLKLQGATSLTGAFTDVGSASLSNAVFDASGNSAPISFTDLDTNDFYKAMIVLP